MKNRLPSQVLSRSKQGFAVPIATWLRSELRETLIDALSSANIGRTQLFNQAEVDRLVREHLDESYDHGKKLWNLLVFALWYDEAYIK
jgi:asparagine synthase (glutamine-hydrolysing)